MITQNSLLIFLKISGDENSWFWEGYADTWEEAAERYKDIPDEEKKIMGFSTAMAMIEKILEMT